MAVCTFFGHRECYRLDIAVLREAIEKLIRQGVDEFLVGHQGQFDRMVYSCLRSLKKQFPHIRYHVVLAQLPTHKEDLPDSCYPEGMESVPPKYAIDRRNRYLVEAADICLCYIDHSWGGAYKFACMAKRRGLTVINLGRLSL